MTKQEREVLADCLAQMFEVTTMYIDYKFAKTDEGKEYCYDEYLEGLMEFDKSILNLKDL